MDRRRDMMVLQRRDQPVAVMQPHLAQMRRKGRDAPVERGIAQAVISIHKSQSIGRTGDAGDKTATKIKHLQPPSSVGLPLQSRP